MESGVDVQREPVLVGKWFHSYHQDGETIEWQGQILTAVTPDVYLVQLFEWAFGDKSCQKLVLLSRMVGWRFYDTHDEMNSYYEQYARNRATVKA
jgi:hypothetical protein